jgi:hypothetical protein
MPLAKDIAVSNEPRVASRAEVDHDTLPDMAKKTPNAGLSEAIAQQKPNPWTLNMFTVCNSRNGCQNLINVTSFIIVS